jgi:hypothetical protein
VQWIKRFVLFHNKTHPLKMGKVEVEAFLTWLAVNRKVSPSTQNQALQAILFLYRRYWKLNCHGWMMSFGPNRNGAFPWFYPSRKSLLYWLLYGGNIN